jgi:REP element-mobilizing transposase RayT
MYQQKLFKPQKSDYGGVLQKSRKGRQGPRPLATRTSMHLVLRSSKARGEWSFRKRNNWRKIEILLDRFARRYGVKVLSYANVGNHLHFHIQLGNRFAYVPFIRALTGSIALVITGASRVRKFAGRFWDYRPFTRIVYGLSGFLKLRDYVKINQMEGFGIRRSVARMVLGWPDVSRFTTGVPDVGESRGSAG